MMEKFKEFLQESFGDGILFRELRLSNEELAYVKEKFPRARITKSHANEQLDGKAWYEISLSPINDKEMTLSKENGNLQQENERLKQELEALKSLAAK
jgi:hypothetical protein